MGLYGAYGYGGYAGVPYAYGAYPYAGAYAAGYGVTNGANSASIAGLAPAAVPAVAGGYAGAGRYVANSAGVVHVAKRSADAEAKPEAEADPALPYGAYGYPYAGVYGGYSTYAAYPATYGYGYRTYGAYPYSYYGKRSADAEADPALLYGSYGYPYAGVYGGYGYRAYGAYPYSYGVYGNGK